MESLSITIFYWFGQSEAAMTDVPPHGRTSLDILHFYDWYNCTKLQMSLMYTCDKIGKLTTEKENLWGGAPLVLAHRVGGCGSVGGAGLQPQPCWWWSSCNNFAKWFANYFIRQQYSVRGSLPCRGNRNMTIWRGLKVNAAVKNKLCATLYAVTAGILATELHL